MLAFSRTHCAIDMIGRGDLQETLGLYIHVNRVLEGKLAW